MKENHFIIKDDGLLYVLQDMPEEPVPYGIGDEQYYGARVDEYHAALQSAINNAVKVENKEDVWNYLRRNVWKVWHAGEEASDFKVFDDDVLGKCISYKIQDRKYSRQIDVGHIYHLECEVEIDDVCTKGSCVHSGMCYAEGLSFEKCASKKLAHITFSKPKEENGWWDKSKDGDFEKWQSIPPIPVEDKEELVTLHNKIMVQWEKDFWSIHAEQKMDAYTVSGFIRNILKPVNRK